MVGVYVLVSDTPGMQGGSHCVNGDGGVSYKRFRCGTCTDYRVDTSLWMLGILRKHAVGSCSGRGGGGENFRMKLEQNID